MFRSVFIRVPGIRLLKRLAAPEQAVKGPADLFGQRGVRAGRVRPGPVGTSLITAGTGADRNQRGLCLSGLGLPDQAAVEALDLAEPADQVHAGAPGAGLELCGPV